MSSARFYRRYIVKKMWLTSLRLVILRRGHLEFFKKAHCGSSCHLVGMENLFYRSGPM